MGRTTRSEKEVLKLIHPGKRIEIYTEPIPASEVLKKYPKFCITRPDVFKFPWIVVKHDSVLVPGKVFFLVPKRTLYRLLKASQPPLHDLPPGPSSPSTTNAGMTPKHQTPHRRRSKPRVQDGGIKRSKRHSRIETWWPPPPSVVGSKRSVGYSSSHVHDCYKCGKFSSDEVSRENVGDGGGGSGGGKRKTTSLRSCMRKPGSGPRLANLRVRFSIPDEDTVEPVTKQRTVIESLSKLAASLMVDVCR